MAGTRGYAEALGWQVWEREDADAAGRPWSGLRAQWHRRKNGPWVVTAVEGSQSGYRGYGLWTMAWDQEGGESFGTVCGLLLPRAHPGTLSVRPRRLTRLAPHRGELTGDAQFERRFRVRWEPGEPGETAAAALSPQLRAALLSGQAPGNWRLSGRWLSTGRFGWMPPDEFGRLVDALIVVAGYLPSAPAAAVAAGPGGAPDRGPEAGP
jgi:hypothetical protein